MYPVLKKDQMLLKQFGESVLYPLYKENDTRVSSSSYQYEKINTTASEILELCDGTNTVKDISTILATRYHEDTVRAGNLVSSFILACEEKNVISMQSIPQREIINVGGNYSTIYPFNIQFEITKHCPLKCKHCFNDSGKVRHEEMNLKEIKLIIDKVVSMGVRRMMITGGEPTSRSDFLDIISYCSPKLLAICIASNGYCITKDMANKLGKYKNIVFQISIDGMEKNHNFIRGVEDSFERAVNSVKILSSEKIPVVVSSTFNSLNKDDLNSVTRLSKEIGAKQITYGLTIDIGRAKSNNLVDGMNAEEIMEMANQAKECYSDSDFYVNLNEVDLDNFKSCGRGYSQICIRENGDVSPCVQYNFVYGNLLAQNIEEIFYYERVEPFINTTLNAALCSKCRDSKTCSGYGCEAIASDLSENICRWKQENSEYLEKLDSIKYRGQTDK